MAADGFLISFRQVCEAIDRCLTPEVQAIGICAPGPLNPKTGLVLNPPNLPGWTDIPLARLISERFGLPCRVENDANAAGLAEAVFGAARGHSSVVYVTLSTGIGTGIVLDGRIYHGRNGAAAEGGHITVDYRGEGGCNCGVPGCIESIASGTALLKRGLDPAALTDVQFDDLTTALAAWLGGVVSMLDPDIIVIGGGLTGMGHPLFETLRQKMPKWTINQFASATPIVPARFAKDVGVLGAASVMFQELASR